MDPQLTEVTQLFGRFKAAFTRNDFGTCTGLLSQLKLLLRNNVQSRGVIRPLEPEVYMPALDILEAFGIKLMEKIETS